MNWMLLLQKKIIKDNYNYNNNNNKGKI